MAWDDQVDKRLADLEREVAALKSQRVRRLHRERWWATFNAVIAGLMAHPDTPGDRCAQYAREAANKAHGPLNTDADEDA